MDLAWVAWRLVSHWRMKQKKKLNNTVPILECDFCKLCVCYRTLRWHHQLFVIYWHLAMTPPAVCYLLGSFIFHRLSLLAYWYRAATNFKIPPSCSEFWMLVCRNCENCIHYSPFHTVFIIGFLCLTLLCMPPKATKEGWHMTNYCLLPKKKLYPKRSNQLC